MANPNNAAFPTVPLTSSLVPPANNNFSTTLSGSINSGDTTIGVVSTPTNYPTYVTIDNEVILVTGVSGSNLTGCSRGKDGTAAASHSSGASVFGYVTAGYVNQISAEVLAMEGAWYTPVCACSIYNSIVQSIPNNANTDINFDTENYDYGSLHSTSVNTNRVTAPSDGLYKVQGSVTFASNSTGYRGVLVLKNGSTVATFQAPAINGANTNVLFSFNVVLASTDYVSLQVYQNSGGSLNASGGTGITFLQVHKVWS